MNKVEKIEKLKICYLSDIKERLENAKKILLYMERENVVDIRQNFFQTSNDIYIFVCCRPPEKALGFSADQVIIDYREPMRTIAKNMLRESCVPEEYQIIDDREIGVYG